MLARAPVTTILPVKDISRARGFYEKALGLKPLGFAADGNFVFACAGDATIALIPKPQGTRAEHTAVSFEVEGQRTSMLFRPAPTFGFVRRCGGAK